MRLWVKVICWCAVFTVGLWAQDQCKPIGWATKSGRSSTNTSVTGGGNATPIVVKNFADLQNHAKGTDAKVIYIDGTVGGGWSGKTGDRLSVGSNKTIVGLKAGTQLRAPIRLNNSVNVIIRNIVIKGPGSNSDQAWDNIVVEGSSKNIWVDHCEFWDGQDGNSDVVKGADNITYSWNIFGYTKNSSHNLSNLIASSDNEPVSEGKLNITFVGNWFRGIAQRGPRCRYGNIHVVNNLYTTDGLKSDYVISAGKDCEVITEKNHFIGTNTPIYTNHKGGSSAHYAIDNIFENTRGNQTGYGNAFNVPYNQDFVIPVNQVKNAVQALAGAILSSPDACVEGTPSSSSSEIVSSSSIASPTVAQCGDRECAAVIQGEDFCTVDGVFEDKNAGFMGKGYVNVDNAAGTEVSYKVEATEAYGGKLFVRYANGGDLARASRIFLGDKIVADSVVFASTSSWTEWVEQSIFLDIPKGVHNLRIVSLTADGSPNIDWLGWESVDVQATSCESEVTALLKKHKLPQIKLEGRLLKLLDLENTEISIFNLHGIKVKSAFRGQKMVDLSALNPGHYIVKSQASNNWSAVITLP